MDALNFAQPTPGQAAAALVAMIEGGVTPSNVTLQQFAQLLGGSANLEPMTPEGKLLYLLALALRSR